MGCRPNSQARMEPHGWGGVGVGQGSHLCHFSRWPTLSACPAHQRCELQNQLDEYKEKKSQGTCGDAKTAEGETLEAESPCLTAMKLQDEVIMVDQSSPGLPVFRICFETLPGEAGVDSCFLFSCCLATQCVPPIFVL